MTMVYKRLLRKSVTSLVAQMVKPLSTMRETRVRALAWEDPLEKEMAIHSSSIAWKIPWTEEPGRLQSMGSQRVRHDWVTSLSLSLSLSRKSDSFSPTSQQIYILLLRNHKVQFFFKKIFVYYFLFLTALCSMQNLSCLTRDWTWALASGVLITGLPGTSRKVQFF